MNSIHHHRIEGIDGKIIDFKAFEGKKILIVNVASACGYTPQYAQLQELSTVHKDKLVVIGCPCNDFGNQEPGSNTEIATFCDSKYKITFLLTTKIQILNQAHSLYKWLTTKALNNKSDTEVKWNFHKFLVDEQGMLIGDFPSAVSPFDDQILQHLN